MSEQVLTAEQAHAVGWRGGSLLLSANAGSGKTSVLCERFAAAVLEDGIAPARVLAITFTERAAGELRRRVRERLLAAGAREAARDTEAALITTIHGFCAQVLRAAPLAAGVDPSFAVLDEATAAGLRSQAFRGALAAVVGREGAPAVELLAAQGIDALERELLRAYDELRSRGAAQPSLPAARPREEVGVAAGRLRAAAARFAAELGAIESPAKLVAAALETLARCAELAPEPAREEPCALRIGRGAAALCTPAADAYEEARRRCVEACEDAAAAMALPLLDGLLVEFGARYAGLKRAQGALDFDDLELEARALLVGEEAVRRRWAERFELIMVDELQDTNPRQMDMIEALERDNALCVGDEFQSIYGFRHADVEIFRARRDGGGASLALSVNFRSRPEVVEAVNATFAERFGEGFIALVAGREGVEQEQRTRVELLLTDTDGWEDVDLGDTLGNGVAWRRAEARLLAERVAELVACGEAAPGDVAVLLRAATEAEVYRQALADAGVPAVAAPSGSFWERQEVADLVAYLGALANPRDEIALCGALASPLGGLSAGALVALARAAGRGGFSQALLEGAELEALAVQDRERLERFRVRFARQREDAPALRADELVERIVRDAGYDEYVAGLPGARERIAAVRRLARLGQELELLEGRDLRRLADRAARRELVSGRELEGEPAEGGADAVRVMTIHAAKGLEFPVVCVADLGRKKHSRPPLVLTDGRRLGLRLRRLDGRAAGEAFDYAALGEERARAEAREEERIAYVALTRARERLILSGGADLDSWPEPNPLLSPLSWLGPALVPDLVERLAEGEDEQDLSFSGHRVRLVSRRAADGVRWNGAQEEAQAAPPGPAATPAPAVVSAPAVVPAQLSYTALSAYAACGYAYYLRRVLGLPDARPPRQQGGERVLLEPAARGRIVHGMLERLDFHEPRLPSGEEVAALVREEGGEARAGVVGDLVALVGAFADSSLCSRLAAARECHRERAFALSLEGLPLLTGVLDVIAQEAGGTLVVDYKSDRLEGGDPAAAVAGSYAVQRDVYALAALRGGGGAVEVSYCFLERPEELVTARFEPGDAGAIEERLRAGAEGLLRGRFAVTERPHRELCASCPGRARLCSWDAELTARPAAAAGFVAAAPG